MTTVAEIRNAIESLSPRERAELNDFLQNLPEDDWDRQMAADAQPGGKLDKLMAKAKAEAAVGELKEFPEPPAS
jgi:hypothetical protein